MRRAFSLIELIAVIVVLALLAGVAIPKYLDSSFQARAAAVARTLKSVAHAALQYEQDYGAFPPDQVTGVLPPEFMSYLSNDVWTPSIPGVGRYNWEGPPGWAFAPGISVVPTTPAADPLADPLWVRIDQLCDDGNLSGGMLRWRPGEGRYMMYLRDVVN